MIEILLRWRHVVSGDDGMSTVEYAIGTVAAAAFAAVLYKVAPSIDEDHQTRRCVRICL